LAITQKGTLQVCDGEDSKKEDSICSSESADKATEQRPSYVLANNQTYFKLLFGLLGLDEQVAQMVSLHH